MSRERERDSSTASGSISFLLCPLEVLKTERILKRRRDHFKNIYITSIRERSLERSCPLVKSDLR